MGIEFNPALNSCDFKPNIQILPRRNSINFGQQLENDRFECNSPARFANEKLISKLIYSNPKVKQILDDSGVALEINTQELNRLLNTHCKDVQNIAKGITENLPFSLQTKVDKKALNDAAYLHDIGKILIPPEILYKNGRLDEQETKIMHKHSELGYEILKNTNLDKKTLNLIRNHHQNAKKSGYPFVNNDFRADLGLQILTMADKYSALTEKRPYKEAYSPQQALTIIYADVKDGKLHPFVFKALAGYVKGLGTEELQSA